jgi:hypothetical protein
MEARPARLWEDPETKQTYEVQKWRDALAGWTCPTPADNSFSPEVTGAADAGACDPCGKLVWGNWCARAPVRAGFARRAAPLLARARSLLRSRRAALTRPAPPLSQGARRVPRAAADADDVSHRRRRLRDDRPHHRL